MPAPLKYDDIGKMEIHLRWIVIFRIFWMLSIPLLISLFIESYILKAIFLLLTLVIFWKLVSIWGHSVIATLVAIVPFYIFLEWAEAPDWIAYAGGFLAVFQLLFIKNRIYEVKKLRDDTIVNESGKHSETINGFRGATELDSNYALAYYKRARAKYDFGDYVGAIEDFNSFIELDPNYTVAYYCRGLAKHQLGYLNAAMNDYKKAARLGSVDAQKWLRENGYRW